MKGTTIFAIMALLAPLSLASPIAATDDVANADALPSDQAVKNAVHAWRADTGRVSAFLNDAKKLHDQSLQAEHKGAKAALAHEKDELKHKKVLDQRFCHNSQGLGHCNNELNAASNTLVQQGTFQSVVNLLADMTKKTANGKGALGDVAKINNGHDGISGRCQGVLPAIDLYFEHAARYLSKKGDNSLNGLKAIRPRAC